MFGETFKKSREEAGLDLRGVAHTLRIQYEYLKALENSNLEKLPPDVYVKAYIREYAKFLNIDPKPLLEEYAALSREEGEEAHPPLPPPKKKSRLLLISLSVSLVIALVAAFLIHTLTNERRPDSPIVTVTPSVSDQPGPQPPNKEQQMSDITSPPVVPSTTDHQESASSRSAPQHTLGVTATETTWLRVEVDEGKSEEVLMKPGEMKKWSSERGFTLKVGNAGGVRLVLDDRDIGVPGEKGQVVKLRLPEESQ